MTATPAEIARKKQILNRLMRVRRGQFGQRAAATTRKIEALVREIEQEQGHPMHEDRSAS